jgi:hypothetical protein
MMQSTVMPLAEFLKPPLASVSLKIFKDALFDHVLSI